jgi:hypothetical protein
MGLHLKVALALGLLLAAAPAFAVQPVADRGPQTMQAEQDDNLEWAASVVRVDPLEHQGDLDGKLFGAAGGDPAMNGLNTYIAFFDPPPENGWRVFRVGDFLDYRIVSQAPGRVLLEVHESTMNDSTGEIGSRNRRLTVTWTPGPDGAPPTSVTVATAR